MKKNYSLLVAIFFFIGINANSASAKDDYELYKIESLSWHDLEVAVPSDCIKNISFFFENVDRINVHNIIERHFPKTILENENHSLKFLLDVNSSINKYSSSLIEEYFSESCLPVMPFHAKTKSIFDFPLSELILDIRYDFINGSFLNDDESVWYVTISSSYRRFLEKDKNVRRLKDVGYQKSVTYNKRMYPRIFKIHKNMDRAQIKELFEGEILIQLDYFIARMIFAKPIWKPHIRNDYPYLYYGTLKDEDHMIFQQ